MSRCTSCRHIHSQAWTHPQWCLQLQISHLSPLQWQRLKANCTSISALGFLLKKKKIIIHFFFPVFLPVDPLLHLVFQRQLVVIFFRIYQCSHSSDNTLSQTVLQSRCNNKNCCGTPCAKLRSTYTKFLTYWLLFLLSLSQVSCAKMWPQKQKED